jgi:hypothetical protein
MNPENLCPGCSVLHPSTEHQKTLVQDGDPVRHGGSIGKGHWLEITTPYKCPKCGARWKNLVESGAGGHGDFWNRIDPPPSK